MGPAERADLVDLLANGSKWEELSTRLASTVRDQKKEVVSIQTRISELNKSIDADNVNEENIYNSIEERKATLNTQRKKLLGDQKCKTDELISLNKGKEDFVFTLDGNGAILIYNSR
jgi:DNA repair exonuclease SbcCD ATPase subunit